MNKLKVVILGCGVASLVLLIAGGLDFEDNKADAAIMLAAFALPAAMGAVGVLRPPFMQWQAAISLAGFAVAAVRTRIWQTLPEFGSATGNAKAAMIVLVVGVAAAALAMVQPENSTVVAAS